MANENVPKVPDIYECKNCHYNTSRLSQYERHLLTEKHIRLINANQEPSKVPTFSCQNCKKTYKYQPSLCKHKKTCTVTKSKNKGNVSNVINDFESEMSKAQSFDKNILFEL